MKAFSIFVFLGKLGLSPIHIDSIYNMLCEKKERVWAISCCPLALVLLFLILSQRERERERERGSFRLVARERKRREGALITP